ncbi:MAG: MATE family efflux transporter [Clostridia bacterium]|nr:MATE family efflux transporter [Clostridia bacterium]
MQRSNEFFATARPLRLFLTVAIPGMISMLAASIYSIIEGIFIGHILGEAAFAAVSIAMPFVMINFSLADLVGVGSSVPISICLGRHDNERANNYFTCSLILILLAGILMGVILFFTSPILVKLMGADGDLADLAVKYVRVYALLGPVTTIVFAMDNYLRISGFVKTSMFLNIFMSCLTAGLVFIFLGVLNMDVTGSALATCCSMTFCALLALTPFIMKKTVLKFVRPKIKLSMLKEIVSCGAPVFLNNIAGRVASIAMNSSLLRIGGDTLGQTAVAAYSVLMYAGGIIEPLLYGMSDSAQPAVGYNWGAKKLDRVRDITKCSFTACGIVSVLGTVIMFFFSPQVVALFVETKDTALLEMSVHALRLFCTAYLFRWFGFAVQGFYSAVEKPVPASVLSVCSAMIFPIAFIFALDTLGLDGLWLNMSATSLCVAVLAAVMLRISQKHIKRDIEKN